MIPQLRGKRCLVTGGSRGLGREIALCFGECGARVAFSYLEQDQDAESTRLALVGLGVEPLVFKGDVADAAHVHRTVRSLHEQWGGVDVLVLNAALMQVLPISLLDEEDWDAVLDTNLKGAYLYARACLRHMIRQRAGSILLIGNFASERVVEAPLHFATSKSGLRGFAESLAKEVGKYSVRVNVVAPGLLETGMSRGLPEHRLDEYRAMSASGRLGKAREVAEFVAWLASDASSFMTGAKIAMDGGL